jgi:hypothetical protein
MIDSAVALAVTLVIAVVYGVIFRKIYPLVTIDAGLSLGFGLAGLLTYFLLKAALQRVKRIRGGRDNDADRNR